MNELTIILKNVKRFDIIVWANNDEVIMKRKKDILIGTYKTDKDKVDINVTTIDELSGKHWFFMQMIFFFVSILGIFDKRVKANIAKIDFTGTISLNKNETLEIALVNKSFDKPAFECNNSSMEIKLNRFYIDKEHNKRIKKLKTIKTIIWIIVIITVLLLLFMLNKKN